MISALRNLKNVCSFLSQLSRCSLLSDQPTSHPGSCRADVTLLPCPQVLKLLFPPASTEGGRRFESFLPPYHRWEVFSGGLGTSRRSGQNAGTASPAWSRLLQLVLSGTESNGEVMTRDRFVESERVHHPQQVLHGDGLVGRWS